MGSYTVYFDLAGGKDLSGGNNMGANERDQITLPKPSRTGYLFIGWQRGDGMLYAAGVSYTVTENASFTAQWI